MIANLIHRTCNIKPLYLVKSRQLSSDRSQYQMKCVNNTTIYVSLKISGSHSLSRIQGDDAIIDAFVNERLRQLLPSTNDCLLQFSDRRKV